MALDTRVIDDPTEMARWRDAWSDLCARSAADQPTRSPLWQSAWWRVFGPLDGRKLRFTLFFEGNRLVGIAPLVARRKWHVPGIPFRRLEWLGSGEAEADEICSEYLGLVAERGREAAVAEAFVAGLVGGALGAWDELVLTAMDAGDAMLPLLERGLASAGYSVETVAQSGCPYIALPDSFDAYLASLPSGRRYLVKRSLKDFDRWAAGEAELHEARTRADLDVGTRVLEALHAERWRAAGKRGVFASPRFRAFHGEVMEALLDERALELLWLTVRGRPIAAAYNVIWNGKVHFYQGGRTLDVPKGIRPGIVLHARAIRRAIEAGRSEYDFLGGTSQYKLDLATSVRPLASLRAARVRLRERARDAAVRSVALVRQLRGA
jgi:CelD/BcsL family acetyltransferase involved in cellulose biosynthesis